VDVHPKAAPVWHILCSMLQLRVHPQAAGVKDRLQYTHCCKYMYTHHPQHTQYKPFLPLKHIQALPPGLLQVMCCDYGFRSGQGRLYQAGYGQIPASAWELAWQNFDAEWTQLRRSFRWVCLGPCLCVGGWRGGLQWPLS
jgi:hypothetical protein